MKPTLGQLLHAIRVRAGLSLEEVAARSGLAYSSVYKAETDQVSPTVRNLEKIAKAMAVEVSYIFSQLETLKRKESKK